MKTILLYKPNSEHERVVLDYLRDFTAQTGKELPTLDAESREGVETSGLYDIMQFPAILSTDIDGSVQQLWVGLPLPRIGEVSYYVPEKLDDRSRT